MRRLEGAGTATARPRAASSAAIKSPAPPNRLPKAAVPRAPRGATPVRGRRSRTDQKPRRTDRPRPEEDGPAASSDDSSDTSSDDSSGDEDRPATRLETRAQVHAPPCREAVQIDDPPRRPEESVEHETPQHKVAGSSPTRASKPPARPARRAAPADRSPGRRRSPTSPAAVHPPDDPARRYRRNPKRTHSASPRERTPALTQ